MRSLFISLLLAVSALTCFSLAPAHAAYNTYGNLCSASGRNADKSAVCEDKTKNDPLTGSDGLLIKIANIIAYVAGAAAVIMIIVAGIRFITANGDANTISSARGTIISALIGLVIIALAGTIINYVVSRL